MITLNYYRPTSYGVTEESAKLCDVVYFEVISFTKTSDVFTAKENAAGE